MANWRDDLQKAQDEARRAREEADRLRREAREMEHRLRQEARTARQAERAERRGQPPFVRPPDFDRRSAPGDTGDERTEETFDLVGVRTVKIDQGAGKLTIRPCAEGELPGVVSAAKTPPKVEVRRNGDSLHVNIPMNKGWILRRRTGATTLVRLEPGLKLVRADVGYGDVQVRDLAADRIKVDIGAGTMTAFANTGTLEANVGAGKLNVTAHNGLVANASTGTGDIQLDVAQVTDGDYKVDVGIGRIEIRLPQGAAVHLETSSGIGKTNISFPSAGDGCGTKLKASTGIGELNVKARSPEAAAPPPQGTPKPQRPGTGPNRREAEELRILQMLEQGKISSQDAADLIAALRGAGDMSGGFSVD